MKTRRTSLVASVALASLLPIMTPTQADAFLHGAAASLKEIIELRIIQDKQDATSDAVDDVAEEVKNVGDNLTDELRKGLGTVVGNLRESLQGEARMKQLEDERARQREIEKEKFEAVKSVEPVVSGGEACEVITRWHKTGGLSNRPDLVFSEGTLASLEQMASLSMGAPIGDSGTPVETVSLADKKQREVIDMASRSCDPAMVEAGLCSAPVPVELQGASYLAPKSILKSNQFDTPEEVQACSDFVKNMSAETGDDLNRVGPAANPNGYDKALDRFSYQARGSLAQSLAESYCAARTKVTASGPNADGSLVEALDAVKLGAAGYDAAKFVDENGEDAISPAMARQIKAQRWEVKPNETVDEKKRAMHLIRNVGYISRQLNDILSTLELNGLLLSNQNSMTAEMLQLQKNAAQP